MEHLEIRHLGISNFSCVHFKVEKLCSLVMFFNQPNPAHGHTETLNHGCIFVYSVLLCLASKT